MPGILEPSVPLSLVAETFQGLGNGLAEEDIFRLMAAIDAEFAGVGKVFAVVEEQVVFLIAQASPGKDNRIRHRAELGLFLRRILAHFHVAALAEFLK